MDGGYDRLKRSLMKKLIKLENTKGIHLSGKECLTMYKHI